MKNTTGLQTIKAVTNRAMDLTTLTDDQLGMLAAQPMDAAHWTLLEDEMARRIGAGQTDEWSFDADGLLVVA
jgi:hypothetical protein